MSDEPTETTVETAGRECAEPDPMRFCGRDGCCCQSRRDTYREALAKSRQSPEESVVADIEVPSGDTN